MTATNQLRNQIAELMGSSAREDHAKPRFAFDHRSVCRAFLLNACPHETLAGTRMDIGDCARIHDPALKADYEQAQKHKEHLFEFDALDVLKSFIEDCNRRVEHSKRKLKESQEDVGDEVLRMVDRMHEIGEQIGTQLVEADKCADACDVDNSQRLFDSIDALREERSQIEADYKNAIPAATLNQQKLRVCEVCSAYLGIHDNDRRLADHFGGKLHLGFVALRERLEALEATVAKIRETMPAEDLPPVPVPSTNGFHSSHHHSRFPGLSGSTRASYNSSGRGSFAQAGYVRRNRRSSSYSSDSSRTSSSSDDDTRGSGSSRRRHRRHRSSRHRRRSRSPPGRRSSRHHRSSRHSRHRSDSRSPRFDTPSSNTQEGTTSVGHNGNGLDQSGGHPQNSNRQPSEASSSPKSEASFTWPTSG